MRFILVLIIFLSIFALTGIVLSKKNKTFSAYFFGERKIGGLFIFFTITASWIGATTTIVTIEKGIIIGFKAVWILGVPTFLTIVAFIFLNGKIRKSDFVSLPNFLKKYYGEKISSIASFLVFFYMIMLAASQFTAFGKFVSRFIGFDYSSTLLIGGSVIIFYSIFGGYLSVIITDGIQLLLISFSFIYLLIYSNKTLDYLKPEDFNLFINFKYNILMVISFTLAWIISPIIWQRIISAKNKNSSRNGLIGSLFGFFIIYAIIIIIAVSLRQFGNNTDLGYIIINHIPIMGQGIVFIGIVSAIISTADSAINIASLTLINDIFKLSNRKNIFRFAKLSTFISGILIIIISLGFTSILKALGLASEIMAEGFFIPGMAALLFKIKKPLAGILSMSLGGGFSIIIFLNEYIHLNLPEWPYSVPYGIGLSLIGFITGYILNDKIHSFGEKH